MMNYRIELFNDALTCREAALKENPEVFPLQMAIDQINYLLALEDGSSSDISIFNKINIGWIAARELDGFPDIRLINKLHIVSIEAKKMQQEKSRD